MRKSSRVLSVCGGCFLTIVIGMSWGCGGDQSLQVGLSKPTDMAAGQPVVLHLVVVADTDDRAIGRTSRMDSRNIQQSMQTVADRSLGMLRLKKHIHEGSVSRQILIDMINAIEVGSRDILFFYYVGQGAGSTQSIWPVLGVEDSSTDFEYIIDMLRSKQARQTFAMADCISAPFSNDAFVRVIESRMSNLKPANIKKLFIDSTASVWASGSIPSQFSYFTTMGGYFTSSFVDSLNKVLSEAGTQSEISWDAVMYLSRELVIHKSNQKQTPQFQIDGSSVRIMQNRNRINNYDQLLNDILRNPRYRQMQKKPLVAQKYKSTA